MFLSDEPVYDYVSAKKSDSVRFMEFHRALLQHGVFIPPSQFETCFLSAAHTDGDLEKTLESYQEALCSEA
jgi:glutamate-1-semialdehyde 2,1-aminomutase